MSSVVSIDGEIREPERATVSVFDRAFLYGDSVFEVLRTYSGEPFALAEHVARLRRSAARVLIPFLIDDVALEGEIRAAVLAAGPGDHYVRIQLSRGAHQPIGYDVDLATTPLRVILVAPVRPPPAEAYERGVRLATFHVRRPTDHLPAAGAKYANYLEGILATYEAKTRGGAEALIVDARGRVLEGATSNVFAVTGGRLTTPPLHLGILAGITRAFVLADAAALGVPAEEREITTGDLARADEVFITSSIREILPVSGVDDRAIQAPGEVTRRLHRAYTARASPGKLATKA
jgi:branched-chain amino acid aminotransferase